MDLERIMKGKGKGRIGYFRAFGVDMAMLVHGRRRYPSKPELHTSIGNGEGEDDLFTQRYPKAVLLSASYLEFLASRRIAVSQKTPA